MGKSFHCARVLFLVLLLCLLSSCQSFGRAAATPQQIVGRHDDHMTGSLTVFLRDERGATLNQTAMITLQEENGSIFGTVTTNSGRADFRDLPPNEYAVQASAEGFQKAEERVSLFRVGEQHVVSVKLVALPIPNAMSASPGPPLLVPKAQKELTRGLQDLRSGKVEEARKHFLTAARFAPTHPDVNYLLGLLAAQAGDSTAAKRYWDKAVEMYPKHVLALTALGETALLAGNLGPAREWLERAVSADGNFWRAHQFLALVLLKQRLYAESAEHAERALQLGKSEAKGARLILAEALAGEDQPTRAIRVLHELLQQSPAEKLAAAARHDLEVLEGSALMASDAGSPTMADRAPVVSSAAVPLDSDGNSLSTLPASLALPKWIPANVDDSVPPVDSQAACPLDQIVARAGQRVVEFVHATDRFTATETLEHEALNEWGLAARSERRTFNYVAFIQEVRPGSLNVEEFRNGSAALDVFPDGVATLGMVSLVLVFHPVFVEDYDLTCEGLSHQRGHDAWQIHFRQKAGRAGRLRSYRLANRVFRIALKGRAWISADSYQVLRMETDLAAQVPDIRLFAEHQTVDYGPVPFQKRNVTLWLPFATDLYLDYKGHRIHRRHSFSNYLLFSVEDRQQAAPPQQFVASISAPRS